jgi:hypothetical protein
MKREDMALEKVVKQPPKPESNAAENGKPPVVRYASDAESRKLTGGQASCTPVCSVA